MNKSEAVLTFSKLIAEGFAVRTSKGVEINTEVLDALEMVESLKGMGLSNELVLNALRERFNEMPPAKRGSPTRRRECVNTEIYEAIQKSGLAQWQVANALHMNACVFNRKLRYELSDKEREEILQAIKEAAPSGSNT